MVSTKNKKNTKIKARDPYKSFRLLTFFAGILFLIVGMRSLSFSDSTGALLNGLAGLLQLSASYIFFRKNKDVKIGGR